MKSILIVTTDKLEAFKSMRGIIGRYPSLKIDTLKHYLSRKKIPYDRDGIKIERLDIIKY